MYSIRSALCFWLSSGAYEWAQKTLKDHAKDKREYLYTQADLEKAKTHDKLWNGAQVEPSPRSEPSLTPKYEILLKL